MVWKTSNVRDDSDYLKRKRGVIRTFIANESALESMGRGDQPRSHKPRKVEQSEVWNQRVEIIEWAKRVGRSLTKQIEMTHMVDKLINSIIDRFLYNHDLIPLKDRYDGIFDEKMTTLFCEKCDSDMVAVETKMMLNPINGQWYDPLQSNEKLSIGDKLKASCPNCGDTVAEVRQWKPQD